VPVHIHNATLLLYDHVKFQPLTSKMKYEKSIVFDKGFKKVFGFSNTFKI